MATGSYLSIITLTVNGLNAPIKRQKVTEWIQKQDPYICCLQETHLETRDTYRLKVKGWKKIFHANRDQKKAGVAILISDKIDFKTKAVKRDKEGYYIMIKGSIQEEDITIINIYAKRSKQSILKEISPGISLEAMMLKLKLQYFGHLMRRADSLEKILMLGGIGGRRRRE